MQVKQDTSLYAQCNFCLQKLQDVVSFNGDELKYMVSICEVCLDELSEKGSVIFKSLKQKSSDTYIDEVPELSRLVLKIRTMLEWSNPEIEYNHIKMSHLPPPEEFAKIRGVGTMSLNRYTEAYEKYHTK